MGSWQLRFFYALVITGFVVAGLVWVAALADVTENAGLLRFLGEPMPRSDAFPLHRLLGCNTQILVDRSRRDLCGRGVYSRGVETNWCPYCIVGVVVVRFTNRVYRRQFSRHLHCGPRLVSLPATSGKLSTPRSKSRSQPRQSVRGACQRLVLLKQGQVLLILFLFVLSDFCRGHGLLLVLTCRVEIAGRRFRCRENVKQFAV
jgi:hypothetical protein